MLIHHSMDNRLPWKDTMTINEQLVKEFCLTVQSPKRQGNRIEFCFISEAPYNDYSHAIVYIQTRDGNSRRFVRLSGPLTPIPQFKRNHTLARYMYQVHLWKTEQRIIPNTLHVDHINDDAMDDRLDNYQLLTNQQNAQKQALLGGVLMAIMICPVCLNRFENPESTTQHAECHKSKKLIFYCGRRCHLASEATMDNHSKYRELRDWISDNQIYKLIRVWSTGQTRLEDIVSDKMLDFDLCKATGVPIHYGSAKFATPSERKVMVRDYRNQGLTIYQIADKMQLHFSTIWELTGETKKSIDLKGEELHETLLNIKHWRNQGYSEERIGKMLNLPRTSVSNYIRRHADEYGIKNDVPASKGDSVVTLICPICRSLFERPIRLTQLLPSRSGRVMCCTGDCRWDLKVKLNNVINRESMREWLSKNQIIRVDKVMPSSIRFKGDDLPYDPQIKTFDWSTFIPLA